MKKFSYGRAIFAAAMLGSVTAWCLLINSIVVAIFGYSELMYIGTKWWVALGVLIVAFGFYLLVCFDKDIGEEIEYYEELIEKEES